MEKMSGITSLPPVSLPKHDFHLKAREFNRNDEDFTIWFLEGILEDNPNYVDCLMYLGNLYTATGRHERGLKIDQRLVRLRPEDPIAHYNLACSYSLLGNLDAAVKTLEKAIALGYKDLEHLQMDRDLDNLRKDSRYQELLNRIKNDLNSARERD
jgi:tetratricopeptide (TPR) repeat protein